MGHFFVIFFKQISHTQLCHQGINMMVAYLSSQTLHITVFF